MIRGITWEDALFQAIVLAAVGFWCWTVYYFRGQAAACLKGVVSLKTDESTGSGMRSGTENKQLYDRFTGVAMGLGTLTVGIAAAKTVAGEWMPLAVMFGTGLAAVCIVLIQTLILKAAGRLTFTGNVTDAVIRTKKTYIAAGAVLIAPAVPMYTGINPLRDEIIIYIVAAEAIAVAVMFIANTLRLFIKQKVSLLVWFLYLCALEIFPVSLAVLLVTRNV